MMTTTPRHMAQPPSAVIRMPALTLYQPWASVVAAGYKTIENRPWPPPKTICGKRIALHAGRHYERVDSMPRSRIKSKLLDAITAMYVEATGNPDSIFTVLTQARGAIIATAVVVGVILPPDSDDLVTYTDFVLSTNELDWWSCDQFGWVLRDVRALPTPIPAVGHQGIWYWNVPAEVELPPDGVTVPHEEAGR